MINLRTNQTKTKAKLSKFQPGEKIKTLAMLKRKVLNGTLELQDQYEYGGHMSGWIVGELKIEKTNDCLSVYLTSDNGEPLIDYGTYEITSGGVLRIQSNDSFNIRSKLTLSME